MQGLCILCNESCLLRRIMQRINSTKVARLEQLSQENSPLFSRPAARKCDIDTKPITPQEAALGIPSDVERGLYGSRAILNLAINRYALKSGLRQVVSSRKLGILTSKKRDDMVVAHLLNFLGMVVLSLGPSRYFGMLTEARE